MRILGRICYGIAAALGLLSLGVEWRTRQQSSMRLFPQPPSNVGLFVALWACVVGLMGKVIEDAGREPLTTGTMLSAYLPKLPQKRAKTLRSDYDVSDQYAEQLANTRPLATTR